MGGESSETSQECGGCKARYKIQMSSSGNTTSVEADPYFPLRAKMIFDIERSRKIESSVGKIVTIPLLSKLKEAGAVGIDIDFLQIYSKLLTCTVAL